MMGDRISNLPNHLLVYIISFLDTRDAIRTGVLSERWRFIWMKSPCIRLNEDSFHAVSLEGRKKRRKRFFSAVDAVILSHVALVLEVFDISFCRRFGEGEEQQHLNRWLRHLTTIKKVKKVHIKFPFAPFLDPVLLAFHLFPCGSITYLEMSGCSFQSFARCKDFTSIETLVIREGLIKIESIKSFFTSCPSLRACTLMECGKMGSFVSFSAPWLKVFEVSGLTGAFMDIRAPNLEHLKLSPYGDLLSLRLDTQRLTMLEIDDSDAPPFEIWADLSHVKKLEIPSSYLKVFNVRRARKELSVGNELDALEHLVIDDFKPCDVDTFAALLNAIPNIQKVTLFLPKTSADDGLPFEDLSCENLKHVKQIHLIGCLRTEHLPFVGFVLKKASALESLWMVNTAADLSLKLAFATELLALTRVTPEIHLS